MKFHLMALAGHRKGWAMNRNHERWLLVLILTGLLVTGDALAQNPEVAFHWAPSPVVAPDGEALAPAVEYQVWVVLDDAPSQMIVTVNDTTYVLSVEPGVVHRLEVRGVDLAGRFSEWSELSAPVFIALEEERGEDEMPLAGALRSNFPNPFNPETRVVYGIPSDLAPGAPVRLEIFNLAGRRVRSLETENTPGWHEVIWNGTDDAGQPASSGMYVTRFVCGAMVETQKMTMLK